MYPDLQSPSEQIRLDLEEPAESVKIRVTESIIRGHGISQHVGYVIVMTHPRQIIVERRYREFDALRQILVERWPGIFIPVLPPKHTSGSKSLKVVNERVKYLTYFLNSCAKIPFVFASEEFRQFLESNNSDLKKFYQKMQKLTYHKMLLRYKEILSTNVISEQALIAKNLYLRDVVEPFKAELARNKMTLINLGKHVEELAIKREAYLQNIRIMYNQSLPAFQKHVLSTTDNCAVVLTGNQKLKKGMGSFNIAKANVYWLFYEAIWLEIAQSEAVIEAIDRRVQIQKETERIQHKIKINREELSDINMKKLSIRQLFNSNKDDLLRKIDMQNQMFSSELFQIKVLTQYVNAIVVDRLVIQYRQKRVNLWNNIWQRFLNMEIDFNTLIRNFYEIVAAI